MLKGTVGEMEKALSGWSDDIARMKTTIDLLAATVKKLEKNVRIWSPGRGAKMSESWESCSTTAIAALLKEAFGLE